MNTFGKARLGFAGAHAERLSARQLLARIPESGTFADVDVADFEPTWDQMRDLGPPEWMSLSGQLDRVLESTSYAGAVVTHGTNLLEETAYFLHLTIRSRQPVVIAGAMRPPSALSSDADCNLLSAIHLAATASAGGCGVLVLLNDVIHSARDVRKASTHRLDAFESRDSGPLGHIDPDGRVAMYRAPGRRHTTGSRLGLGDTARLPRVDIVLSYAGQDGTMIDAAVAGGAAGIVVAGSGGGWRTPLEDEALDRAIRRGVAIVVSTRVGAGRVVPSPQLRERGIVTGDDLGPYKARVLLMLGLVRTRDPAALQSLFDEY
jgi:L-asparaginase